MTEPTTTSPPRPLSQSALRVVLFGMPDAGKSSLLGALAQAAQTQEHVLNGHLTDLGHGLAEMQRRLYDEGARNTLEEVLPFPVVFEAFSGASGRTEAVIIDCDGRVANDFLSRRRELSVRAGGELGRAILQADAVVFVVDVSASDTQIEADFTECARFLRLLEERRGQRAEVGGLPVFLVLTKCDLLARPGDDLAAWFEKIEERKRQVGRRFEKFLDAGKHKRASFGSIDLHVWATAVKRPELADSPVKPREPYGVAELFRQCFLLARAHRSRLGTSGRRLLVVLLGIVVALAALSALPVYIVLNRPSQKASDLETEVNQFRAREQELAPAGRYRQIQDRIDRLYAFRRDKAFDELPDELKEYVQARSRDLEEYQGFADLVDDLPDPRAARNEAQLKEACERVERLNQVEAKHSEWKSSDAGRRLAERQEDAEALDKALRDVLARYEKVLKEGRQVLKDLEKPNLPTRARKALDAGRDLPDPKTDANKLLPGSERVTYTAVFGFDAVKDVLRQWESVRKELDIPASLLKP